MVWFVFCRPWVQCSESGRFPRPLAVGAPCIAPAFRLGLIAIYFVSGDFLIPRFWYPSRIGSRLWYPDRTGSRLWYQGQANLYQHDFTLPVGAVLVRFGNSGRSDLCRFQLWFLIHWVNSGSLATRFGSLGFRRVLRSWSILADSYRDPRSYF
jgi:hypothetical protein